MSITYKDYSKECEQIGIPDDKRYKEEELEDWVWKTLEDIIAIQGNEASLIHCLIDEMLCEQQNLEECETCDYLGGDGVCKLDVKGIHR